MDLRRSEFDTLLAAANTGERIDPVGIAKTTGWSVDAATSCVRGCVDRGWLADGRVTPSGIAALDPFKVDNAVIMAAGMSTRFAPISYEKPKGVLRVRGEILIERQIQQLLAAGISDISVVVGYKKEYFFYLAARYGVKIVVNPDYDTRNNNSTLWRVRDLLSNTFVCSSDDYFTENPFQRYVYRAYYAAQYVEGPTDEWCMVTDSDSRINDVTVGGRDAWIMLGHAYFDRAFSAEFVRILGEEYTLPQTADKLWESIFAEHLDSLDMEIRPYPAGLINEFDSLDEVRNFDPMFIENVDSDIFDNIASILDCVKSEIHGFYPLKQGITNLSCHFAVRDREYVYRYPGVGTEKMVDRSAEKRALELAKELGLDDTFIYEDPEKGWKISRFIPHAQTLDPHDPSQRRQAMEMCRTLHDSGTHLDRMFDFVEEGLNYEALLAEHGPIDVPGYGELKAKVLRLRDHAAADEFPTCLSHNDFFHLNFLIEESGRVNLIDWEYAGMSDVANDFGTFVVCCELDKAETDDALVAYLGRSPSLAETRHFWAYIIFAGWCWYVWALAKEAEGDNVGEWLYIYYRYAADYADRVLGWYENGEACSGRVLAGREEAEEQ